MADKVAQDGSGRMSALCFPRPRAINLHVATWTLTPAAVTCRKCRKILDARENIARLGAQV